MKMLDNALLKKLPAAPKTPGKPFVPTEGPACDKYAPTMKGDAFESSAPKKIASPDGGPKDAGAKFKDALDTAPDAGDKFKDGGDKLKEVGDKFKHFITQLKAAAEAPSAE